MYSSVYLLPTCLPPTCSPPTCLPVYLFKFIANLSTADLSTADLSTCTLLYVYCRPVYRRPVYLYSSVFLLPTCLFRSAVCHKHCMTVSSVLYMSAVGRFAIPYCNSDVVLEVGGRQATVLKNYMTVTSPIYRSAVDRSAILYIELDNLYTTDLSTADLSILYSVFVDRRPADLLTVYLPSYSFVSAYYLLVYRRPVNLSSPHYAVFVYCATCLPAFLFLCIY